MAKKFDMGDFAKTLAQPVSDSDTAREQIEYIDVDLLDSDPGNFYRLNDLEGLADNIAVIGLQQPVRVRAGENGHVVIVSGHRRTAAIRKLVAEGREDLRQVPCIRETAGGSPALRELRLIYANSSTRSMSSAEISQQAEKVQELLYRLKEEGYEFPGRMRDHVAEACKISRSKLARLGAIRRNLSPDIRKCYWDSGKPEVCLSENAAYELSGLPVELQRQVVDSYRGQQRNGGDAGLRWLYAGTVESIAKSVKALEIKPKKCPEGGECGHRERQVSHLIHTMTRDRFSICGCETAGCCARCSSVRSCKAVCQAMLPKQREAKAAEKEEKRRIEADTAARQRPQIERIDAVWERFADLRRKVRLTPKAYLKAIDCPYSVLEHRMKDLEAGTEKLTPETELPFGYHCHLSDVDRWRAAADALGCTVDYLMMRTDDPRSADEIAAAQQLCAGQAVLAAWMPGALTPPAPCEVVADVDVGGGGPAMRCFLRWRSGAWRYRDLDAEVDSAVVRWLALPKVEEDERDD